MSNCEETQSNSRMIREYFRLAADRYSKAVIRSKAGNRIVELAGVGSFDIVLDVGAGTGRVYRALSTRRASAIAVDISPEMLRELRRSTQRAPCVLADARWLPFRDSCFDKVVSNECWVHLLTTEDQQASLKEIARVLKFDGKAVIGGVRNMARLKIFMPGVILWSLLRVVSAARGRRQVRDALREIKTFVWGKTERVGFVKELQVTVYNFTPGEIFRLFTGADLSICQIHGRRDGFRVPFISYFASPLLGYSLIDILAKKS